MVLVYNFDDRFVGQALFSVIDCAFSIYDCEHQEVWFAQLCGY